MRKISVLLLVGLTLLAVPQRASAQDLQKQIARWYTGWQKEDVKLMWDLLNPEIKEHTNFDQYATKVKQFFADVKLTSFKIRKVSSVSATYALAEADVVIFVKSADRTFETIDKTPWVLKELDKVWYFAGSPRLPK